MSQRFPPQIRVPATYIRGGTSKGVFFRLEDLPEAAQVPGEARDALCLRVIGSPDPYGKHTDGMGGATSSTSKIVIVSPSSEPGHDVDYLFGQVSIDQPFVDWSGNCGNLSAAVGPFAIASGSARLASVLPMMGAAAVGAGCSPEAALRALTLTPAEILGVAKDTGSLSRDKFADVLVTDGPLFASDSRVMLVLSKGRTEFERK